MAKLPRIYYSVFFLAAVTAALMNWSLLYRELLSTSRPSATEDTILAPFFGHQPRSGISGERNTDTTMRAIMDYSICATSSRGWEVIFESMLGILFREKGFLPREGSVLDVGAQFGEQACHFALLAPNRKVYALDPSPKNVQSMKDSKFGNLTNLNITQAGVGRRVGTMKVPDSSFQMSVGEEFRLETLDSLFHIQGEMLAFAHIDVEGLELEVLQGGVNTIRENFPVFTVELRVHRNATYSRALLDFIHDLGYDSYVVDEVCGWPHMDYRNILNVPRSLSPSLVYSDAFSFAMSTEAVFRVDSSSVFDMVYPCCAVGGECCPGTDADSRQCCSQPKVNAWLRKQQIQRTAASRDWLNARKTTLARWKELESRATA